MATINVENYGAKHDGSTDDSGAIQSAVEDAQDGDTVKLPGADNPYLVSTGGRAAVDLAASGVTADDLTIRGDPEETVMLLNRESANPACMGGENTENAKWNTITVEGIIFDGDKATNGDGTAFKWYADAEVTGRDITIFNCLFRNAVRGGYSESPEGISQTTVRYCTGRNNDSHGFNPQGIAGNSTLSDPDTRIFNILSIDNDGSGIDFHGGVHDCSAVYVENPGSHGLKAGAAGGKTERLRITGATIKDPPLYGWTQTSDGSFSHDGTFTFDNFRVDGAGEAGIRADEGVTIEIGTAMVERSGNTSNGNTHQFMTDDTAVFDADEIVSQNAHEGDGIFHASTGTSTVSQYFHYDIPGDAVDVFNGTVNISEQYNQEQATLETPTKDEVGAFTAATGTADPDSGPQPETAQGRTEAGGEDRGIRGNMILPRFVGSFLQPVDIATLDTVYMPAQEPEKPSFGAVVYYDNADDELKIKRADGTVKTIA